ncbi:MAG: lantibiotic dehydratase C-terminal domain-containing protein [Longimicrobiaceae bacterium]
MDHLALNVYYWGRAPQVRLLVECLGPALGELREEGLVRRCWWTRFDARGPHLSVLLATADGGAAELRNRLGERVAAYLAEHPSTEPVAPEELEKRHAECRGKQMCALDAEPGFAPNNTFGFTDHAPAGYPFWIFEGLADADRFWDLASGLSLWTIARLRQGAGTRAAVRWVADVDHALRRAGADPAAFWRHHATTLLPPLAGRLESDEAGVLQALPASVGERNRAAFAQVWAEAEATPPAWPFLDDLLGIILAGGGAPPSRRWMQLREVDHCTLAQLDQPVLLHVPLVLYAWQRNLEPFAGPSGSTVPAPAGAASTSSITAIAAGS